MSSRRYSQQTIRGALARGREDAELRRRDAEAQAAFKKGRAMSHKVIKGVGPVPRPPEVSALDALLDDWQDLLDQALEAIDRAAARERALNQSTTSSERFPSLGGQS
jgi:hypothetical protein